MFKLWTCQLVLHIQRLMIHSLMFIRVRNAQKTMLFTSRSTMMEHYIRVHETDCTEDDFRPYCCLNCSKHFTSEADLAKHVERAECRENLPYRCKHCKKTFQSNNEDDFEYHVLQCANFSSDNSATHFECSLCGINFIRHHQLVEHHRNHHMGEKVFKCEYCDAKFSWQDNLERHIKIHEEPSTSDVTNKDQSRVVCRVCSNPFHSVVSLSSHMSLSHPDHPLTLDGSWGIKPGTGVKRNRKILPAKSQPMLKLVDNTAAVDTDLSEFVAELAASNKRKMDDASAEPAAKVKKEEPIAELSLPDSATNSQVIIEEEDDLGVHKLVNAVAAQNDPHSLYCNTCDKTYQNPSEEDTRSGMNLRCVHCGWTFHQPYQLEAHLDHLHPMYIRQSICQICSAQLKNNTAMDRHYASDHSESRAFHCYQCDSRFNTKSCLRGHLLRHQQSSTVNAGGTGEHICPHCSMRYAHAHQLLTHVTKSHPAFVPRPQSLLGGASAITAPPLPGAAGLGNTQFVCGFCSKKFAYEGSLKIHIKSHEEKIKAQVLGQSDTASA